MRPVSSSDHLVEVAKMYTHASTLFFTGLMLILGSALHHSATVAAREINLEKDSAYVNALVKSALAQLNIEYGTSYVFLEVIGAQTDTSDDGRVYSAAVDVRLPMDEIWTCEFVIVDGAAGERRHDGKVICPEEKTYQLSREY